MTDRSTHRPITTVYGYPRQGANRQLKKMTEAYWAGRIDAEELSASARELRLQRVEEMRAAGIVEVPSNDFSLYDHVLDAAVMLGAVPDRHIAAVPEAKSTRGRLDRYFAMARGTAEAAPLEMTKWFDTNYHYLVPEIGPHDDFVLDATKPLTEFREASEIGVVTRPVVLGPVSFLLLAKPPSSLGPHFSPLALLDRVLPIYLELLQELHEAGVEWVQLDEPALVTDQPSTVLDEVARAYQSLGHATPRPKILVASYFDRLGDALLRLCGTPIDGLALDFTGPAVANLEALEDLGNLAGKRLVAGIVDGRNVWQTDLTSSLAILTRLLGVTEHVDVAASCSLLHVPLDVTLESGLDAQTISWLAFARQKLGELQVLARGLADGPGDIETELLANQTALRERSVSPMVRADAVRARSQRVTEAEARRLSTYRSRRELQRSRLNLPILPTTTIGSFPQTAELRQARASLVAGRIDQGAYDSAMRDEIRAIVDKQESIGLDVLVHGEPERNDMVQYFAEQLDGFIATANGWVQSYGTRYVRPPIILGDVSRPRPMTVSLASYAQSLTELPIKGMLTGPVTMLAWSFVRDDQPLGETARQVALALREEVADLEAVGIAIIQVDEPALRETLPLRHEARAEYLAWAVEAFRLTTAGVRDDTQVHTHMCYAEFGDVLEAIAAMDADVISLEAARSRMEIVGDLARANYPNEIGPGVWDIHSPRVPSVEEIAQNLRAALAMFPPERLWVNPDCGLKTRGYAEVTASLSNLVAAAKEVRAEL